MAALQMATIERTGDRVDRADVAAAARHGAPARLSDEARAVMAGAGACPIVADTPLALLAAGPGPVVPEQGSLGGAAISLESTPSLRVSWTDRPSLLRSAAYGSGSSCTNVLRP